MKKYIILLILALIPVTAHAAVIKAGENQTTLSEVTRDDAFLVGQDVVVKAEVQGELLAFGSKVTIETTPARTLIAGGQTVEVKAGSGYNTIVMGDTVRLAGTFMHDVYVVSNHVTLDPSVEIRGNLEVSGSQITLAGIIKGNVVVHGTAVSSRAVINGNINGSMTQFSFEGGSVDGNINYESKQDIQGLNTATVKGVIERADPKRAASHGVNLIALLASLLFIAFVVLITPRFSREITAQVKENWGRNLIIGLCILIIFPLVAMLFLATLIGWKVALLMVCLYALFLLLAGVYGTITFGEWLLQVMKVSLELPNNTVRTILVGALGVLVLFVVSYIPIIGGAVLVLFWSLITVPVLGGLTSLFINEQR